MHNARILRVRMSFNFLQTHTVLSVTPWVGVTFFMHDPIQLTSRIRMQNFHACYPLVICQLIQHNDSVITNVYITAVYSVL